MGRHSPKIRNQQVARSSRVAGLKNLNKINDFEFVKRAFQTESRFGGCRCECDKLCRSSEIVRQLDNAPSPSARLMFRECAEPVWAKDKGVGCISIGDGR